MRCSRKGPTTRDCRRGRDTPQGIRCWSIIAQRKVSGSEESPRTHRWELAASRPRRAACSYSLLRRVSSMVVRVCEETAYRREARASRGGCRGRGGGTRKNRTGSTDRSRRRRTLGSAREASGGSRDGRSQKRACPECWGETDHCRCQPCQRICRLNWKLPSSGNNWERRHERGERKSLAAANRTVLPLGVSFPRELYFAYWDSSATAKCQQVDPVHDPSYSSICQYDHTGESLAIAV